MRKPTKRKAFQFLRSYFDVLNELEKEEDKLSFLMSIINKQFLDEDPEGLNFIVNLCYESQRHQIEKSVKGYKMSMNTDLLGNPIEGDPKGDPKEEKGEEKEEGKEEGKDKGGKKNPSNPEQVKDYFMEIGLNGISEEEAYKFFDYYTSIGWVVGKGKTPMKDWKAAARNWKSRIDPEKLNKQNDKPKMPWI